MPHSITSVKTGSYPIAVVVMALLVNRTDKSDVKQIAKQLDIND